MAVDYQEYEKKCREIREANEKLLELFAADLSGLSSKTVKKHVENAEHYISSFLLYEEPLTFEHGIELIGEYLGYYLIRKWMWSTPGTIRSTAASIKKFYKCMMEHGKISRSDYDSLREQIKDGMPVWQQNCAQYNDPDEDDPFDFF